MNCGLWYFAVPDFHKIFRRSKDAKVATIVRTKSSFHRFIICRSFQFTIMLFNAPSHWKCVTVLRVMFCVKARPRQRFVESTCRKQPFRLVAYDMLLWQIAGVDRPSHSCLVIRLLIVACCLSCDVYASAVCMSFFSLKRLNMSNLFHHFDVNLGQPWFTFEKL